MSAALPSENAGMGVITSDLHRVGKGRGKAFAARLPLATVRRAARVAITLAVAHKLRRAIDRGEIRNQADAARKFGFTRARLTQILALTNLAPDLQEEILFLEVLDGHEPLSERALRGVVRAMSWTEQRRAINAQGCYRAPFGLKKMSLTLGVPPRPPAACRGFVYPMFASS